MCNYMFPSQNFSVKCSIRLKAKCGSLKYKMMCSSSMWLR